MEPGGIHHFTLLKYLIDGAAGLVAVGTVASVLPSIAAIFTILWLGIRIWESDTVRGVTGRRLVGRADD